MQELAEIDEGSFEKENYRNMRNSDLIYKSDPKRQLFI